MRQTQDSWWCSSSPVGGPENQGAGGVTFSLSLRPEKTISEWEYRQKERVPVPRPLVLSRPSVGLGGGHHVERAACCPQATSADKDLLETPSQADSEITFDQISGYPAAPSH